MTTEENLTMRTQQIRLRIAATFVALGTEAIKHRRGVTDAQMREISRQSSAATLKIANTLARAPELDEVDEEAFNEGARAALAQIFDRVLGPVPASN